MERDDFVLCVYDGIYHYVARLLAKYDNPECAEAIWGTNDEGRTWRYMYFLTKPIRIYQPVYEYEGYLHSRYQGFTRIADTRLEEIEKDYGSMRSSSKRPSSTRATDCRVIWSRGLAGARRSPRSPYRLTPSPTGS